MQLIDDSVRWKHPTRRVDAISGLETVGVLKVPVLTCSSPRLAGWLMISGGGNQASPPRPPFSPRGCVQLVKVTLKTGPAGRPRLSSDADWTRVVTRGHL